MAVTSLPSPVVGKSVLASQGLSHRETGLARTPQLLGTRGPGEVGRAGAVEVIPGDKASPTIETGLRLQENRDRDWLRPGAGILPP